ncbi:hypothetical protein KIW84_075457 [Lathyrus oleraceus]|uniref:Uncharacterized protein n=1 Tax=Pisum sativum TaxID=3888 RepID=A0A9D4VTR4_PEA|nr:hypothetical protein KIW84_075457 [Pisum sativum]
MHMGSKSLESIWGRKQQQRHLRLISQVANFMNKMWYSMLYLFIWLCLLMYQRQDLRKLNLRSIRHLKSQPHVKPSGELPVETPTELTTRQIIDIHEFDTYLNNILDEEDDSTGELRGEDPQNVVFEVQYEKNVEADKDNDIPIAKRINENVPSIDKIAKEIIFGQVNQLPKKCLLSSGSLSVKYDVLNRNGPTNWEPINHSSGITITLAKLIFQIGTKTKMNIGEYVFEKTMKQVDSFVVKIPITFPCLLNGIILNQHPGFLHLEEAQNKKAVSLAFDYKLLSEHMFQTLW